LAVKKVSGKELSQSQTLADNLQHFLMKTKGGENDFKCHQFDEFINDNRYELDGLQNGHR